MFKVESEEFVNKTLRLPQKLVASLQKIADQKNISLNKLVILCCDYAIENMEEE